MSDRPRKGRRVAFTPDESFAPDDPVDNVAGLRFTIIPQHGAEVRVDYTALRPRRLALAFARALRQLAAPGGTLTVRSTVQSYANTLPRFFAYLAEEDCQVDGPEDLRAHHVDGFESWLEAQGLTRIHLFTLLVKVTAALRQVAGEPTYTVAPDLTARLRYISSKPFERSSPRDAYSPFVARQLRDAARLDIDRLFRRLGASPPIVGDAALRRAAAAVGNVIADQGIIGYRHPAYKLLYTLRRCRDLSNRTLIDDLHGRHHLLAGDIPPLLSLLSLETGLEIECCKALTVDCLRNASAGTVEVVYLKRRARGAEHKSMRVRDGGVGTPGGLIRRLIDATAVARRHQPSSNLWLYLCAGRLRAGILHPQWTVDAWTRRHALVDDEGHPLQILLSRLRKTHKALWYLKTEGHMARFAVGHTVDVAARHYADLPSLRPLHEAAVADAFGEAVEATRSTVLSPDQEDAWRAVPDDGPGCAPPGDVAGLLDGNQDVWLASCAGFHASPFGEPGSPCPQPFWGCLDCPNAVITARKLPAILAFQTFIENERAGLTVQDWRAKFGQAHARITGQILPAFSDNVIATARAMIEPATLYLPPEVRA